MKYADKQRRDVSFSIGEWVYVKLQPHKQTSVEGRKFKNYQNTISDLIRLSRNWVHGLQIAVTRLFAYPSNIPCFLVKET